MFNTNYDKLLTESDNSMSGCIFNINPELNPASMHVCLFRLSLSLSARLSINKYILNIVVKGFSLSFKVSVRRIEMKYFLKLEYSIFNYVFISSF